MKEIWKDIKGYEGNYQVSNLGNVKSVHYRGSNESKNLVPKCNNSGRLWVELRSGGRAKQFLIHRLVASAFIENPDNLPQINHIDENPKNNVVSNLEWCTGLDNIRSFTKNHPFKKRKLDHAIKQCKKDGTLVKVWTNVREIEIETNWSAWSISECCRNNRKTAYGYIWQYAN